MKRSIKATIGIILVIILLVWTVNTLMISPPDAPDAAVLGGEGSEAYLEALSSYEAEVQHGHALLTLGLLVTVAYFFITEVIPIAGVAMFIPCYYSITGIMSFKESFDGFTDTSVILFGGMFVIGEAMFQTGLAQKIGRTTVKMAAGSQSKMILAVMIITGLISSCLSNTGTVAVLLPVCLGIADSQGWSRSKLLMPLSVMASSGGMITMVGTPPNITAAATLMAAGIDFGFFDFAWYGIPVAVCSVIFMMLIGNRLVPDRVSDIQVVDEEEGKVYDSSKQIIAGVILVLTIIFMAIDIVPLASVAVIGALVCVITGCLNEKQAYAGIGWETIFLFGGALSLANAMANTGAGALLANAVIDVLGATPNPYVLLVALFLIAGTLTQFMSNTAAAALLCPIGLSIAQALGANPVSVVLAIGFASSSAYITPVATPPNTMVYGPGGFKFLDYAKVGTPLFLINLILAAIIMPIIWPFY